MATITFIPGNNVNTTLAAAASSSATTLTLASSAGLPTLSGGAQMPLTLNDAATGAIYEIVYVTAITGATLTVVRAQEGTTAQNWNIGDFAFCAPTAGTVAQVNGNPANQFQIANATASNQAVALGQTFTTGARRMMGLRGNVNASTPLTQFDLSADACVAIDSSGRAYAQYGITTSTVNLALAGPIVNGRDQSAAFTASTFVHIYRIYNPTSNTWGWIASAALPTVGPTLPTGYTAWAYSTTLNWNASSNIVPCFVEGAQVVYDLADAGVNRVLTNGTATSMTAVACSGYAPPNAIRALIIALMAMVGNVTPLVCYVRRTGSTTTGQNVVSSSVQVNGATGQSTNWTDIPMNSSQSFDYRVNVSPSSGGVSFEVRGFIVANGDS
ncbi:conserved hypothetical protein [Ricinus communis]|uniref:Uncharacterized protein n=1 Tax=Ricinus communis TaxID=3988 RepID=B9TBP7_RICCO|nr:conserved hypothetical protein [Ricinus communis]